MGGNKDGGARIFSVLSGDRTRENGHNLKFMKLHLNTRKHFFYGEGGQSLEQVAQRDCRVLNDPL